MSDLSRFRVVFKIEGIGEARAELIRIKSPLTVDFLWRALPVSGRASVWKNAEVYFPSGLRRGTERATRKVEKGEIAYWPMGDAVCVFYGENVEPYSDVNILGRILMGLELFGKVKLGTTITLDRARD